MASTTTTTTGLPPKPPPPPPPPGPLENTAFGGGGGSSGGLPPKPITRRQSSPNGSITPLLVVPNKAELRDQRRASTLSLLKSGGGGDNDSSSSSSYSEARAALLQDVNKYKVNLTTSEVRFLEDLIVFGTDAEVTMAHRKLLDEKLFGLQSETETEPEQVVVSNIWINGSSASGGGGGGGSHNGRIMSAGTTTSNGGGRGGGNDSLASSFRSTSSTLSHYLNPYNGEVPQSLTTMIPHGDGIQKSKSSGSLATDNNSVGSERRQEMLQQRREENLIFDQIWHAHEQGLALTQERSRRSIRNNGLRFSNSSAAGRNSAIFRRKVDVVSNRFQSPHPPPPPPQQQRSSSSRGRSKSMVTTLQQVMNDNRSDNMRRRPNTPLDLSNSSGSHGHHSLMPSSLRGVTRRSSLRRLSSDGGRGGGGGGGKPRLQRLLSDSSRKSVSFMEQQQDHTQRSISGRRSSCRRSVSSVHSLSSFPSIHMAHSIRSATTTNNSVFSSNSIPAIPHARAMRSLSTSSVATSSSLYYSEGQDLSNDDDASMREEKKVSDLWPKVPSKVEIRQTENSAKYVGGGGGVRRTLLNRPELPSPRTLSDRYDSFSSEYFLSAMEDSMDAASSSDQEFPTKQVLDPIVAATPAKKGEQGGTSSSSSSSNQQGFLHRPVLMREVSVGEGVEVADFAEQVILATPAHMSPVHRKSLSNYGFEGEDMLLQMANSFDETMSFQRMNEIFRRPIKRSISDDAAAGLFVGGGPLNFLRDSIVTTNREPLHTDTDSWQMDDEEEMDYYDPWMVIEDDYENGYGGGGTLPFQIIGTSAGDTSAQPHVLSPPLMESLQQFLPFSLTGENFWLKYSLVRDGASMHTFLKHVRNAKWSILALETMDGEVFGAFTSECWRKNWNFFGTGDSFLWRMRNSRGAKSRSIIDQARRESEIDVFPYTGDNNSIQYCINDRIAVGGGNPVHDTQQEQQESSLDNNKTTANTSSSQPTNIITFKDYEWGHGLSVQNDMLEGTSSPCLTFGSPPLSKIHADGSIFEIINLELWAFTPCYTLEEAEKLELGKLFLEQYNRD